eukprot:4586520-Prymnesium_polylepis.1
MTRFRAGGSCRADGILLLTVAMPIGWYGTRVCLHPSCRRTRERRYCFRRETRRSFAAQCARNTLARSHITVSTTQGGVQQQFMPQLEHLCIVVNRTVIWNTNIRGAGQTVAADVGGCAHRAEMCAI